MFNFMLDSLIDEEDNCDEGKIDACNPRCKVQKGKKSSNTSTLTENPPTQR